MEGQADLLQVVLALKPLGGASDFLDRGQQKANQHRNYCDHHEEFNQGESKTTLILYFSAHFRFPLA
jgi:hypothetical protein